MELPLTLSDGAGQVQRDVLVRCDPSLPVGDLMSALASHIDGLAVDEAPTAGVVFLGPTRLDNDMRVAGTGLRPGKVLTLGQAPPAGPAKNEQAYELAIIGGLLAGTTIDLTEGAVTVGRSARCDVVLPDDETSRLHASITSSGGAVTIEDLHSSNGTTVNGAVIGTPTAIRPGDFVGIGGSILTLRHPPGPAAECEPTDDGRLRFNKPPRRMPAAVEATFQLPEEPQPVQGRRFSLIAAVSPLLIGVVIVAVTGRLPFLLFSLASPVMLGANAISDRRTGRRTFAKRMDEFEKARASLTTRLQSAVRQEEQDRRNASPDPATVAAIATTPTQQLWERRRTDADYLVARIGLADCPAGIKLVAGAHSPAVDPPIATTVPVTVPVLSAGVVGIAGPRAPALSVVRSLVVQLAALHSPNDLIMVLLAAAPLDGWEWIKWLPHTVPSSASGVTRLVGVDADQRRARIDELVSIVEHRKTAAGRQYDNDVRAWPTILLLLDDVTKLRAEEGVAYLLHEGPSVGVVAICIATESSGLPAEASASLELRVDASGHQTVDLTTAASMFIGVLPDGVEDSVAVEVARALAPLFEVAPRTAGSSDLPAPPLDHLDLLHMDTPTAGAVLERWAGTPSFNRLPSTLGVTQEGAFTLDLCRDGPHALIAGTTGAGKSELLQTLVASLALASRPDVLTFLLVDFKGGSAFKDCAHLPHTLGIISNLDGRLVERALDSLQAELRWRQARFNEAGAKDYEEYGRMRSGSEPAMPRLVVVVDELKELSDAYGEAIVRLNQTARLGRSLGLHLVLATQKPALVPGLADLRANTDLRLCLRVQDDSDSRDLVGIPDAASIRRTDVGRGIARLSDGSLLPFQTGYLGGRARSGEASRGPRIDVQPFDLAVIGTLQRQPSTSGPGAGDLVPQTGLQILVEAVAEAADQLNLPPARLPWLAPLPTAVTFDDPRLAAPTRLPVFPIGLIDLPDEQRQDPLLLDFDNLTHVLVIGPARSGRSTFLRSLAGSIASRASPSDVHLYCLEFRRPTLGDLEQLPHCGAVVGVNDTERLERTFLFFESELEHRGPAMSGRTGLADQRSTAGPGAALPYIIVLCDNYEAFYERFSYEDGGRMVSRFGALLSEGPSSGIHFVITTDSRGVQTKLGTSIDARLLLRPTDRDDQLAIGVTGKTLPFDLSAGRGFWYEGPAETQVAQLGPAGTNQVAAIVELGRQVTGREAGLDRRQLPRRIPPLPTSITAAQGEMLRQFPAPAGPTFVTMGVAGVEATPVDIDLQAVGGPFVIAGPRGSGRSTTLLTLATSLLSHGQGSMPVCVLAPRRSPLRGLSGHASAHVLDSMDSLAGDLTDLLASVSGPLAIIIDDAEMLIDNPVSTRIDRIVRSAADNEWLVVIGGTTADLARRFSGWIFDARQSRSGIVLQPSSVADGEVLDLRLPRSIGGGGAPPPGRGILAIRGKWTTIQVFLPSPL